MNVAVAYGRTSLSLDVPDERLVPVRRAEWPAETGEPATKVRAALAAPTRFPPLFQAFTPDDHVAIIADAGLPDLADWIRPILEQLDRASVSASNVAVLFPTAAGTVDLPGVKVEHHDPSEETRRAYLATTASGKRVYMNRTLVEADQLVVLAEVRYSDRDVTGGPNALYPAFAEFGATGEEDEAEEVAWLLGLPFFVHVIAGPAGGPGRVIAGPPDTFADAKAALKAAWTGRASRRADIVVAGLGGSLGPQPLEEFLNALDHARRAANPDGTIVLLSEEGPPVGEAFDLVSRSESPAAAKRSLEKRPPGDAALAERWLKVVDRHRVVVMSGWPDELVEDLFATPIQNARQVQRLIDSGGDVLILHDAHRMRVGLERDGQ